VLNAIPDGRRVYLGTVARGDEKPSSAGRPETRLEFETLISLALCGPSRGSGLGWLREVKERCPELKVIVISVHDGQSVRRAAIEAGADVFVPKRAIVTDLLPAIARVGGE
jgi:DNA-binding NarL/FixJ family response regulator